jgi:hypothetical protein
MKNIFVIPLELERINEKNYTEQMRRFGDWLHQND